MSAEVMNTEELRDLNQLEITIAKGQQTFLEVGVALAEIRNRRLYRVDHSTFESYCREKWKISRVHAHRLIGASDTVQMLPTGNRPSNERQTRPLTALPPEKRAKAWEEAVKASPNGKPTAKGVREVVARTASNSPHGRTGEAPGANMAPLDGMTWLQTATFAYWQLSADERQMFRNFLNGMALTENNAAVALARSGTASVNPKQLATLPSIDSSNLDPIYPASIYPLRYPGEPDAHFLTRITRGYRDMPEAYHLYRIQWQIMGHLTFRPHNIPDTVRMHMFTATLRKLYRAHRIYSEFRSSVWVRRSERGSRNDLCPHFHFLLAGLPQAVDLEDFCVDAGAFWKKGGGGRSEIEPYNCALDGAGYIAKLLRDPTAQDEDRCGIKFSDGALAVLRTMG